MMDGYKAWNVSAKDFPEQGSDADRLRFLVNYAVLAPSKYNAQPWLFEVCGDTLELTCNRSWAFHVTDPQNRELIISCGAALLNLCVAAEYFGYTPLVEPFPCPGDSYLLARIRLHLGLHRHWLTEDAVFEAIPELRIATGSFRKSPVADQLLKKLCTIASEHGVWLQTMQDAAIREKLATLVSQADHQQMAHKGFRAEAARWINPSFRNAEDGISGTSYGLSGPINLFTPELFRKFNLSHYVGFHHRRLIEHSPVLAVLGTDSDSPRDWLQAGEVSQLLLLQASVAGISASFLNQPIEVKDLRSQLSNTIGRGGYPQLMLRLGYGASGTRMPRQKANEVLM